MRSTDIAITRAVRDIILDLVRDGDGTPLTPQTTIQEGHDGHVGDIQVTVDDVTQFGPGMLFSFYDGTDEEDIPITSDWVGTNPVTLNFAAMDYQGLRFAHSAGTRVGTNLFTEVPNSIDDMLVGSAPLVYIVNLDQKDVLVAGHQIEPVFSMHVEYRRALVEPSTQANPNATLHTNVWGMRQQKLCRLDFEQIAEAIRGNTTLTTAEGEHCIALGDPQNPNKERFSKTWQKIIVDPNVQHFAAMGDFSVRGFREVFYGDAFGRP